MVRIDANATSNAMLQTWQDRPTAMRLSAASRYIHPAFTSVSGYWT